MAHLSPLLRQATPIVVANASGLDLVAEDGMRYLDFSAGIGVTSTGHCHPHVVAAIRRQAELLLHGQIVTVRHRPLLDLCERLGSVLPPRLDAVFFANSGSEAIESAIRLARQATGRGTCIAFRGGFHGRTMGAAALTSSSPRFVHGAAPLMGGTHICLFPEPHRWQCTPERAADIALRDFDHTLRTVTSPDQVAAVFVEPVLGEGGCIPAADGFLQGLRERADAHGFILVFDEVQTGYGRTGKFWAHQHWGVEPDILVSAKGLTGGLPLSCMVASDSLMRRGHPGSQGGTFNGNAVACAAAIATLEIIESEHLVLNAAARGRQLLDGLHRIAATTSLISDVRGLGLMVGCEISEPAGPQRAERLQQRCLQSGLIIQRGGPDRNVLRFLPALTVTEQQILDALDIIATATTHVGGSNSDLVSSHRYR